MSLRCPYQKGTIVNLAQTATAPATSDRRIRSFSEIPSPHDVLSEFPLGARRAELVPELPISWSPDGSRLAVAGFRAGSIRLYIVNTNTGGYRLVQNSGGGIFPAFSPDGTHLAFTVSRPEFGSEIATDSAKDLDGTAIMELLQLPPGPLVGRAYRHLLEVRIERGPLPREQAVEELVAWAREQGLAVPGSAT